MDLEAVITARIEGLEAKIDQATAKIDQLADRSDKASKKAQKGFRGTSVAAAAIATGLAIAIRAAFRFGQEAVKLSQRAEDVEKAFEKIAKPGLLDELRKQTGGTVSDLELMERALDANDVELINVSNTSLQLDASLGNLQKTIGDRLKPATDAWNESLTDVIDNFNILLSQDIGFFEAVALKVQDIFLQTKGIDFSPYDAVTTALREIGEEADKATKKEAERILQSEKARRAAEKAAEAARKAAIEEANRTGALILLNKHLAESAREAEAAMLARLQTDLLRGVEDPNNQLSGTGVPEETAEINIDPTLTQRLASIQEELSKADNLATAFGDSVLGLTKKKFILENAISSLIADGYSPQSEAIKELISELDEVEGKLDNVAKAEENLEKAASAAANAFSAAASSQINSVEDVTAVIVNAARRSIAAQLSEGVAAAIKSALVGVPFPLNIALAATAGASAGALFSSLVPRLATGSDRIQRDGLIFAHQGEVITPAAAAPRNGETGQESVEVTGEIVMRAGDAYILFKEGERQFGLSN